jgi:hypothetical protein
MEARKYTARRKKYRLVLLKVNQDRVGRRIRQRRSNVSFWEKKKDKGVTVLKIQKFIKRLLESNGVICTNSRPWVTMRLKVGKCVLIGSLRWISSEGYASTSAINDQNIIQSIRALTLAILLPKP